MKVVALFVDPCGPYPARVGLERCYDAGRDGRSYHGPWPVVAHPPCQLWGPFASINFKRWGGDHNRPGNDAGCFAWALAQVRAWGGVLEHPAGSKAWPTFGLPRPPILGWGPGARSGEWTCEVWQSAYGHKARKRTWLYYAGVSPPLPAIWDRAPGTHQIGWFDRNRPVLGKAEASRTPEAFADYLIRLASRAMISP